MADFQPPPTYALPIRVNEKNPRESTFDPIWLKWFIDLAAVLSAVGAGGGGVDHNLLTNLQGGTTNQYYHVTSAQHTTLLGAKSANTVYAGPATGAAAVPTFRALVLADLPSGTGDVVGPGTATDNAIVRFDGTTGKLIQNSTATIADSGVLTVTSTGINATPIGATTRNTIACTTLNANGAVTLGDAAGDALTIAGSSITWSNAPTHSNSHSFSGSVKALGGTLPAATTDALQMEVTGGNPDLVFVQGSASAGNRLFLHTWVSGAYVMYMADDTVSASTTVMQAEGGHSAGLTLVSFPSAPASTFGHTAALTVGNSGRLQVVGTTDALSQAQVSRFSANAGGPSIVGSKSRSGTAGTNTIVQADDVLLNVIAYGADGTNYDTAAAFRAEVDGTPAGGTDMPGRWVCLTSPGGSATLTEAWRVDNAQKMIFQVDRAVRFNNQTSAAGANLGTITNAPTAGDPGYWLKINIGGTNYALPAWAG